MRISRRQALQIPIVGVVVVAAGCGRSDDDNPPAPDPLIALADDAFYDAADARSAATRFPDRANQLTVVANEREAHGAALRTEVDRLATATPTSSSTYASTFSGDIGALRDSINKSSQRAAAAARNTHGYRAGLLASISASCAVHTEVLLA